MMGSANRQQIVRIVSVVSAALAAMTLFLSSIDFGKANNETLGACLLGFWALVPPVWFWFEWVALTNGMDKDELDSMKHTHDLSRNIWLGLLGFLAFRYGLHF